MNVYYTKGERISNKKSEEAMGVKMVKMVIKLQRKVINEH